MTIILTLTLTQYTTAVFYRPDALLPPNQQRHSTEGVLSKQSLNIYFQKHEKHSQKSFPKSK